MQKALPHLLIKFGMIVNIKVQDLFHSLVRVLFNFPSRYLYTIGYKLYLGLEDGSPMFKQTYNSFYSKFKKL